MHPELVKMHESGTAEPASPVSVRLTFRNHTLVQDKPAENGGQDLGPMASELLLGAVLGCQHSTFIKVAAKRRLDARLVKLEGGMNFQDGLITEMRVVFHVASPADDAAIETAMRLTEKTCTISRALSVPVHLHLVRA